MEPVVSFSTNTTKLVESEASVLTFNFTVEGDIPEGGLPISLKVDANLDDGNQWFFDFDAGRPSVNSPNPGEVTLRPFARNAQGIDGRVFRDITLLPDVTPPNDVINLVITENTASFDLPIFDDGFAERGETVVFTLQDGEGYTIDAATTPAAISLQDGPDGVIDATNPVVSLSVDQTTVTEGQTFTVNFNVEGDIPEGGLEVYVDGDLPGGLSEFGVDGVVPVGAGIPGPDGDAGGFVVTLFENQASLTLPVFKDGLGEGVENLSFTLIDGELYEANTAANQVTLTIEEAAPIVSIDTLGGTFNRSTLITPNLVETSEDGTAVMSVVLKSDAPVPEEGLIVNVNSDIADITKFVEQAGPAPEVFGGEVIGAIYNDQGMATGFQVRMDQPNAVINFTGVSLEAEGAQDVTFMVEAGEGYELSSEMSSSTITVYDTIDQVPAPTSTPEVGLSISTDELREGRGAATLNFTVNGEIPAEGVVVYVNSGVRAALGEFDLFNAGISGGAFPAPDGRASGFYFKITEPTASITLQAVDDDIDEGLEALTFSLEEVPGYTIASDAASDTLIIADGRNSEIQVSLTGEPEVLVEADGTVSTHIISLSAPPPAEGITVRVSAPNVGEFDLNMVQFTGATLAGTNTDDNGVLYLDLTITAQEVMIELPVRDEGVVEGLETAVFTLVEGEGYEINPEASGNSFTIVDTADQAPVAVEDAESNDTIDTAIATGLSADNNVISVDGSISFSFRGNRDVDQTEDVDMYSFELKAGDTVSLDIDSIPFEQGGFDVLGSADLRLFDADGNELAYSSRDGGPGELFASGRDSFIEYTATADGTYYVGVSQYLNENYDPNVKGTGDGLKLTSRGIGAGPYNLEIKLNPEAGSGTETFVEYTGETAANAPFVTFNAAAATFSGNDIVTSQIVESLGVGRGQSAILTLSFAVDGEIPEGGLEVILKTDADFTEYFDDVSGSPRTAAGGEIVGAVYNADGSPAGIKVLLTSSNASFPMTIGDRDTDDENTTDTVTFSLANSADYALDTDANSTAVTFYDTLDQVTPANAPEIGISIDKAELIESEGTEVNVTFNVTGDIPADGVQVYVDSETGASLGEFDVFNAEVTGASFPTPNNDASGFYFRVFEDGANIKLKAFDETTNPEIPAENALEGVEEFTFSLVESGDYTVNTSAESVTLTIKDNPDSVVIEDNGGDNGGGNAGPTDNDNDRGGTNNDTIADAVDLGLTATNPTVTVDGAISQRFRGDDTADASEDVDMYAFTLEAGQTIILDVDAGGMGDAGVEGSLLDSVLRVFDANGNELANVGNAPAPDEAFQSNGDPYLEFTAPEAGTYYAAISNLGNDSYDPNVANSGSGWTFDGRFEPGDYKLNATLDIPPVVSFEVTPDNFSEEDPDNLVEWKWTVTGKFPAEGITVNLTTSGGGAPFAFLDQFAAEPGAEFVDADIVGFDNETGDLNILLTSPEASFKLYFGNDIIEEGAQPFDFFLVDGDGYTVDAENNGTIFNITDDNGGIGVGPTVGLTVSETNLAEGDAFTVNFNVTGDIPPEGVQVLVQSDMFGALGQFDLADLSNLTLSGIAGLPEVGDNTGSSFLLTITEPQASIGLSVFDDIVAEDVNTINFTLANGELYQVDPGADSVTLNVSDEEIPGAKPTVSLSVDKTDLVEGDKLTLSFAIDGEIPAEGLTILVNDTNSAQNQLRSLTEFDISALELSSGISGFPEGAEGDSGFFVTITEPTASITLPVIDDNADEIEADEVFTFEVIDGEEYDVNADASSVTINITDLADAPPVVSFSVTPEEINEAEGTALVMNFSVEGDIPEGGITVNLEGDAARIMQQFTVAQTRFDSETGEIFYRFDNGFANNTNGNIVGGTLNRFSLEDGDSSESASNEAAAGDAFLSNFQFTITEPTASITIPVFNDIIEEADATYTYNLVDGDGYRINAEANSGTFTVTDGVVGGEGPRVEILATPGTLYENEQTEITINLRTRGDIPEGGLVVFIEGPARAISEFDINATNPRLPEDETVVEGPVVTGGSIVGSNEAAGGFFFRITESSSSITVPVFQDDVEEGSETFTFTLRDGEEYQVREGRESVTVTIDDVLEPPVVTMTGSPTLLKESDGTSLELNFTATGTVPESGTTVVLEITDPALSGIQLSRPSNEGDNVGITIPSRSRETITDEDGNFVKLLQRVTITEANATLRLPVVDDIFTEEDAEYTINLVEGEGYNIDAAATNSATFTISDGDLPAPVTVGVTATPNNVYESEQSVVSLSFNVESDIPAEGVEVFLDSDVAAALGEFDINGSARTGEVEGEALVVSGGEIIGTDNDGSGFFFRIDEANATIQVPVFPDEEVEGAEAFTFALSEGEAYNIDQNASAVSVTIDDVAPEVSFSVNTTNLSEEDATLFTFSFSVSGVIPEGGVEVALGGELLPFIDQLDFSNFDFNNPDNVQGVEIGSFGEDGSISLTLLEPSASLSVRVFDDVVKEADASFDLMLLDGDGYSVNQEAKGATVTVTDGVIVDNPATVSLSLSDTSVNEGEEFTVNFSVDSDVSVDNPLTVLVQSTSEGALGEFNIFKEDNTPAFTTEGIMGVPTVGDDTGSSFLVELTDTEASINLSVFNDGIGEGTETFNFALVDGERYNVDATNNQVVLTIEETPAEIKFEADANGEISKFTYDLTNAGNAEVTATVDQEALDITDAAFDNYVGFYEVVDENGGIDTNGDGVAEFNPGDAGYAQAALENAVDGMALRLGGNESNDTTAGSFGDSVLQGGTFYAPFAIANAGDMTVADFLAANPDNMAATEVDSQVAYFAFGEANPDGANHLKSWGDGIFGFEDLPDNLGVSDNDFNDAVFKFDFTA